MLHHALTSIAMVGLTTFSLTVPTQPPTAAVDVTGVVFSQPAVFGGGAGGAVSPAGCALVLPIQQPHVSTYEEYMNNGHAVKGKAFTKCNQPVSELTLSVSVFDYGSHTELLKGRPVSNKNQKALGSKDTLVPCVNTQATTYQVGVLGTSYENGHEYQEIAFSKPVLLPCGHS